MAPSAGVPFDFNQPAPGDRPRQVAVAHVPPGSYRHPLGLPRGSVRALLAFMVLGIIWTLMLLPKERVDVHIPLYLYFLMFLILGHYFAARSHTPSVPGSVESHPLWLPRGCIRFLILFGFLGVIGWAYYSNPEVLLERLKPEKDAINDQPYLPLVMVGAFFLGTLVSRMAEMVLAGPEGLPPWFQDVQAWISLLAIVGLSVEVILQLVIQINLTEVNLYLPHWQSILTAVIAFYFGARS